MRRTHLKGRNNILKRLLLHAVGFNLALLVRKCFGIGKPRTLQGSSAAISLAETLWTSICAVWTKFGALGGTQFAFSTDAGQFSGRLGCSAN